MHWIINIKIRVNRDLITSYPSDFVVLVFHVPDRDDRNIIFKIRRQILLKVLFWLKQKTNLYEGITTDVNCV